MRLKNLPKSVEKDAQGKNIAPDNFLWTGTDGMDLTAIEGDYCLRIGVIGRRSYWNLYYKDKSIKNGNSVSFSMAKLNCIEAYNKHYYGR